MPTSVWQWSYRFIRVCQNSLKLNGCILLYVNFISINLVSSVQKKKTLNNMYPYHSTYACILLFFFSLFPLYVFFSPYAVKSLLFSHHLLLITIPPLQIYPNRKNISPGIDLLANPIQTRCAKFLNGKRQMNQQILLNKYLYNSFIQQISSSNCVSDSFLNIIFLQLHCQSSSSSLNISK